MTWARIVLVHYNSGPILARTLAALAAQTFTDFEVVIVDNASPDRVPMPLPDHRFLLKTAPDNLGFAAGSNWGAEGAATPWLITLNPDAVPEPDWLEQLHAATRRHSGAAMFGSTQIQESDPTLLDGAGDCYSIFGLAWRGGYGQSLRLVTGDFPIFSPCAAAALYRRDVFRAAGGFAESFFCYLEDVDLGLRLRLWGHSAVQVAKARVRHQGSVSSGRHSDFTLFHSTRNGLSLIIRCLPGGLALLAVPLFVLAQIWLMGRNGAVSPRLRGLAAGVRTLPRSLQQRRIIQAARTLSTGQVARLLAWSPRRLSRRAIGDLGGASPGAAPPSPTGPTGQPPTASDSRRDSCR